MSKLVTSTFVTLDGVMQAPGGPTEDTSGGFKHGGWLAAHFDAEAGAFMGEMFTRADAFLLGRGTYDIFASYWPKHAGDDPVSKGLNTLPKHVVSRTLKAAEWNNSHIVRNLADEIGPLKSKYAREIQVHGSHQLIQSLINGGWIDEMHVLTFPVIVGGGKRLFENGVADTAFKLASSRATPNGVVISTYQRTDKPTYATVAD